MTFAAAADNEPFTDVEVITLKQHCRDIHTSDAFTQGVHENKINNNHPDSYLQKYFNSRTTPEVYYEFVKVRTYPETHVIVGVDRELIDDEAIDYALTLLEQIDSFSEPSYTEFGAAVLIVPKEVWQ